MLPAWQPFEREGKGDFGCEGRARGTQGRREEGEEGSTWREW